MSTFGSSVINKSGKKFAPKAPIRRAAASNLSGTPIRASVERQNQSDAPHLQNEEQGGLYREKQLPSQTLNKPQTHHTDESGLQQHAQVLAKSPVPIPPVATPSSSVTQISASTLKDVPTSIPIPLRSSSPTISSIIATPSSAVPSNIPQKRPALPPEPQITQEPGEADIANGQLSERVDSQPIKSIATAREAEPALERPSSPVVSSTPGRVANVYSPPPSTLPLPSETSLPAAKRRRIEVAHPDVGPAHALGQNDVTVPTLSETIERSVTDADENSEAQPHATELETNSQPSRTRNLRLSEKAKGKQPMPRVAVSTDAAEGSSNGVLKKKNARNSTDKKRRSAAEDAAASIVAHAVQGSSAKKGAKRGRKAREPTPEGADAVKIMPSQVRMSELCKNTRTGKKSTRAKELENLDKAEAVRKSQQELQEFLGTTDTSKDPSETAETAEARLGRLSRARQETAQMVPNTIIIDGEIQIDETSLQIDRHANAAAERDAEALEGIDESELTRRVTQNSWLKRDIGGRWTAESTDRFYEALRMFGTDFDIISKLFPGRTRRSIKLKFVKEEKADQARIKQVLLGERILVDMDEYSRLTNTVYGDPRELEKDLAEDRKRMEEEQRLAKEAIDEAAREREREVEAERAAGEEEEAALGRREGKEGKVGKKRGRAKKKKGDGVSAITTTTTTMTSEKS